MAKFGGKLMKLRSALKRLNSLGNKLSQSSSAASSTSSDGDERLQTVYVGMSGRIYQVDPELLGHLAVQELVGKYEGSDEISVGCEVVMFDHLLWMIENSDSHIEPLDDIASFYAYQRYFPFNLVARN